MEELIRDSSDSPRKAFDYLRSEAVEAHLAGDGVRVLHLCTIALEHLRRTRIPEGGDGMSLAHVRWAYFLNLYWMLDDWMAYSIDELSKRVTTDEVSSWDQKLIGFLLTTLHIPLNFGSIDELKNAPAAWLQSRSNTVEDLAALTLALELTWYKDCHSSDWKELASAWLSRCPVNSALCSEIKRVSGRLTLQSAFCGTGTLPDNSDLPAGTTEEQSALVEAWRLYHEARFSDLDAMLRKVSGKIRLESYPTYFRAYHFSRMSRESKESQFLSLSRVRFIESRQPAQACQQLRDERFESSFAEIARKGFPDGAATERFTCFRMAMLNQLHALRSWDIGGWVLGERQRAHALLELAARGDIRFVKLGILALRNSLGVPERREYPHFDRSIELLDALPEDERRTITRDLIRSPRVAWAGAHRVLSELSDAIPPDTLAEVAQWNVGLDIDEYYAGWKHTWLGAWGNLLHWSDDATNLIEILKPALLRKAGDFGCWEDLHGTLCSAIIKGNLPTAREILQKLIGVACDDSHFNESRYSVLHNVVRHRAELAQPAREWLQTYTEKTQDAYKRFMLRHINGPPETDIDDNDFRDWLRTRVLAACDKRLEERGGTVSLGIVQYHAMMFQLAWPQFDVELAERLIAVINTDYVPFTNKGDPIACLAILASRCPANDSAIIVDAAMNWLENGITGRDLGHTGPLSTGQWRGLGPDSIVPALAFLIEVLAEKQFDAIGQRLAKWIIVEGLRQPTGVVDHTLRTAFHCSIGKRNIDEAMAVALVGIAEGVANAALRVEPAKTVAGFSDVILKAPLPNEVSEWLSTSAGKLCLELWERRLIEVSLLARPSAREAAASAIRDWEKSGIELPQALREARDRLAADCRLRVRKAISA